jgi:transposase InsO family protein
MSVKHTTIHHNDKQSNREGYERFVSKASDDLEYILVIIDQFTRYVELFSIKDTSAEEVVQPLIEHIGRYGVPYFIQSDRGTQFVDDVIRELTMIKETTFSQSYNELIST